MIREACGKENADEVIESRYELNHDYQSDGSGSYLTSYLISNKSILTIKESEERRVRTLAVMLRMSIENLHPAI